MRNWALYHDLTEQGVAKEKAARIANGKRKRKRTRRDHLRQAANRSRMGR